MSRFSLPIYLVLFASAIGLTLAITLARSIPAPSKPALQQLSDPTVSENLARVHLPAANLAELATHLGGRGPIEATFPAASEATYQLGSEQRFWVSNMHGSRFQIQVTLLHATAHSRMWVQHGLDLHRRELAELGIAFEAEIYPGTRRLLGVEAEPSGPTVDLVFTDQLGPRIAGYFSPDDLVHPQISETSNGRRMIVINTELTGDRIRLDRHLAHELQHLMHWELDANESVWLQEGFSVFAEQQLGYENSLRESAYLSGPDLQFIAWPVEGGFDQHYGAAFLLIQYLYDRFGSEFLANLARQPQDSLYALDASIHEWTSSGAGRQPVLTSEDVIMDWGIHNLQQLAKSWAQPGDRMEPNSLSIEELVGHCNARGTQKRVHQFGFDYIRVRCDDGGTLEFSGAVATPLLPTDPHSGDYFLWSNRGNLVNTSLTRRFDFTHLAPPITLRFWTWYDLERNSDFVYLLASEDGERWSFLETTSGVGTGESLGVQLGFGFSGINRRLEWSQQTVDLSAYAGNLVTLRFEYVTDTARSGEGFLIDDVSVLEAGYQSDFEYDLGGWRPEGFVRISNWVPQEFRLSLLRSFDPLRVEHLTLDDSNSIQVALEPGEELVMVIMAASRQTRQPASYALQILK